MEGLAVGRLVHYVAYGTPGGEFPAEVCRAAVITEIDDMELWNTSESYPVGLCVMNPTGLFFNRHVTYSENKTPGTWHWPEKV